MENGSEQAKVAHGKRHSRAVFLLELVAVTALSGWIFFEYLHNVSLQDYVKNAIESNATILQFAAPVGVVVIAGSLFLQRRRDLREERAARLREELLRNMKFGDSVLPHAETLPHHPMVFERPARDPNFQFRKTRKKGRISRIREAERLPPGDSS